MMTQSLKKIVERSPLVHNITNYVVMNNTANALLALGASPVMAHAREEVEQMATIASSLVVNVGTLSAPWVDAMEYAMVAALAAEVPIVYDPVGAGATDYRNSVNKRLLAAASPTIIRGNGSEIMALAQLGVVTKGVDSTASSDTAIEAAQRLYKLYGSVVVISGATDYIVCGDKILENHHGTPLMTRVTGMGCTSSAVCGAFVAVNPDTQQAAYEAMTLMGMAGEKALSKSNAPGSFQVAFIDALYEISQSNLY